MVAPLELRSVVVSDGAGLPLELVGVTVDGAAVRVCLTAVQGANIMAALAQAILRRHGAEIAAADRAVRTVLRPDPVRGTAAAAWEASEEVRADRACGRYPDGLDLGNMGDMLAVERITAERGER